jgi:hypothetical protein
MDKAVFNPGHYTHASGFNFQQDAFQTEVQDRLLALIDSYGIVSGYGFSDDSSPNNPAITVSHGLAYDGSGREVRTTPAQRIADMSYLSGLTAADVGKVIVVETALSGVDLEAHPITGEESYTRYVSYPVFSLVATGAVDPSKHVRIGRISSVTEGAGAEALAYSGGGAFRDILSYPTTAPFIVVGPAGDAIADYTGSDADPFNDAIAAAKSASNGGVIVVRPGTYTIDTGNPVVINGLQSLRIAGMGLGTVIEGSGGTSFASPKWKVSECDEVIIENMHIGDAEPIGSYMRVRDVEKFVFRNNQYGPGGSGADYGITFSSGVTWAKIENNYFLGPGTWYSQADSILNFLGSAIATGGVRSMIVQNNDISYTDLWIDGTVQNLLITNNSFFTSRVSIGFRLSPTIYTATPPKRVIVANNQFDNEQVTVPWFISLESAASGTIVNGNTFYNVGAEADVQLRTQSSSTADYSVVSNNTFTNTFSTTILGRQLEVDSTKCVVKGNTFKVESGGLYYGIILGSGSANCIVDSNVFINHNTHIDDNGSSNWAGSTDNTSNKEL